MGVFLWFFVFEGPLLPFPTQETPENHGQGCHTSYNMLPIFRGK